MEAFVAAARRDIPRAFVLAVVAVGVLYVFTNASYFYAMKPAEVTIRVDLGRGSAATTVWTCGFSYDYVKINAEYRT